MEFLYSDFDIFVFSPDCACYRKDYKDSFKEPYKVVYTFQEEQYKQVAQMINNRNGQQLCFNFEYTE